jgi:hypothetical protein
MTPKFLDPLQVQAVLPNTWKLLASFTYLTLIRGCPELIKAETGFNSDLASIPRLLRWLIPVNGRHRWPAVTHDKLYSTQGVVARAAGFAKYSRKECDQIMDEGMKVMGVPLWKRTLMYRGVRAGGWVRFNKGNGED